MRHSSHSPDAGKGSDHCFLRAVHFLVNGAEDLVLTAVECHEGAYHGLRIDTVGLGALGSSIDERAGGIDYEYAVPSRRH
jgi:hypothetical protein